MSLVASISAEDRQEVWRSFAGAVGAELRDGHVITGASGLDHRMEAIAVDEKQGRLILVSAEASPRTAALMQVDVQATLPDTRVLVARPVIFDIGVLARRMLAPLESPHIPLARLQEMLDKRKEQTQEEQQEEMKQYVARVFEPVMRAWKNAPLPTFNQIMDVVNQASYLDWKTIGESIKEGSTDRELDLTSLFGIDNTAIDRRFGVCAVPLFEFEEADWALLLDSAKTDELRARLAELNITQYFFPSPDQLALGLVDQGLRKPDQVVQAVSEAPGLGHPLSRPELVDLKRIPDVVEALRDVGYVVDGEYGVEVAPAGTTVRTSIKFRPREGIVSKVLNRFNLSLSASPRDFLPPH